MRTKHIASYLNQRGDIEVTVTLIDTRYVVRIHDIDAEETLPTTMMFTDIDVAKAYALQCAADGSDDPTDYISPEACRINNI